MYSKRGYVFTVDTGTTNTRVCLFDKNRQIIGTAKREVGVRNTAIDGNNQKLKAAVRDCLETLLSQAEISYDQVSRIIASGMITSNVGLAEIPHLTAPVSAQDLAHGIREILCEDVCPLPISFIPGIKNTDGTNITLDNYEQMDIMRGEEVESIAILHLLPKDKPYLLVLPGSHTKFVAVDKAGRITGCLTTISGELLNSVTNNTLLADSTGRQFVTPEGYDREMFLEGFKTERKCGIGRACFSGRILSLFGSLKKNQISNYVMGVCLASDLDAILHSDALKADKTMTVVISGKDPLRQALCDMLQSDGTFTNVETFEPDGNVPLSSMGACIVADLIR